MGLHRLAVAAAALTLLLIFAGGSVTSNDAGMAFPDWPTVEGQNMFLYPPSKWVGDKFYEHVHRLLGAATGLLMIVIALWAQMKEPRRQARILAWVMLGAVIVQGVLGGIRVTEDSVILAVVHGCLAQAFLCLTACLVLLTSPSWLATHPQSSAIETAGLLRLCVACVAIIFGQLLAGAIYRHLGYGLVYHVVGAAAVTMVLSWLLFWISGSYENQPLLMRLVKLTGLLLIVQLCLGVGAYVSTLEYDPSRPAGLWEWLIPSLHVAVGAAILAVMVTLTVSVYHAGQAGRANSQTDCHALGGRHDDSAEVTNV